MPEKKFKIQKIIFKFKILPYYEQFKFKLFSKFELDEAGLWEKVNIVWDTISNSFKRGKGKRTFKDEERWQFVSTRL